MYKNIRSNTSASNLYLYAAAVQQTTTLKEITDKAASGNYGPLSTAKVGILLPHEPIEVTCANELNMRSVSTILLPILA